MAIREGPGQSRWRMAGTGDPGLARQGQKVATMQTTAFTASASAATGATAPLPTMVATEPGPDDFARHFLPNAADADAKAPDAPASIDSAGLLMQGQIPLLDFRLLISAQPVVAAGPGAPTYMALDGALDGVGGKTTPVTFGPDPAAAGWPALPADLSGSPPNALHLSPDRDAPSGPTLATKADLAPPDSTKLPASALLARAEGVAQDTKDRARLRPLPAGTRPVTPPLPEGAMPQMAGLQPARDLQVSGLPPGTLAPATAVPSRAEGDLGPPVRPDSDPAANLPGRTSATAGGDALLPFAQIVAEAAPRALAGGALRDSAPPPFRAAAHWQVTLASEAAGHGADPAPTEARSAKALPEAVPDVLPDALAGVPKPRGPRADLAVHPSGQPSGSGPVVTAAAFSAPAFWTALPDPLSVSGLALEALLQGEIGLGDTALSGPFATAFGAGSLATAPGAALSGPMSQTTLSLLATQINGMLARQGDGTTEFTLSPEELGRVRITLQPESVTGDRVIVMLSFDRPETLDLFRRHADLLSEALQAAGYSGSSIGFSQSGAGNDGGNDDGRGGNPGGSALESPTDDAPRPAPFPLRAAFHGALDLRL